MRSSSSSSDDLHELFESDHSDSVRQTGSKRLGQAPGPKQKRVRKERVFVETWLQREEFKNWLEAKTGSDKKRRPFCKFCSKTGLKRHLKSKTHEKCVAAVGAAKTTATVSSLSKKSATLTHDRVKSMEIKLCAFLAEHDLAISLSDDLVDLLRSLFPKDEALKNLTLGKQKTTNVIRQVLGFDYLHEAVSSLQSRLFSVIIDETTDLSTVKQLAVLATYFDWSSFQSKYYLLDMVEVEAPPGEFFLL